MKTVYIPNGETVRYLYVQRVPSLSLLVVSIEEVIYPKKL